MSDGRVYRDENWLRRKYWDEELTAKEMGELAGVSDDTILRWMKKHDIDRRPTGGVVGPTEDEFIEALQNVAARLGKSPTVAEYRKESHENEPSVGAAKYLFGSWNAVKKEAGLEPRKTGPEGPSRDECIRSLQRVADKIGDTPSTNQYNEEIAEDGIPAASIKHVFGSWNAAKSAAGLEAYEEHGWDEPEIIEVLSEIVQNKEKGLSKREYRERSDRSDPSVDTISRVCGSWNDAIKKVGLTVQPDRYTEEECIEALTYVADKIGRSPTMREYQTHRRPTDPSPWVMKNTFESWNYMKQLANLRTYDDGDYINYPYGADWDQVAARIRDRDDHACRLCGMKYEKHYKKFNCNLEVHHIYKIESFYDTLSDDIKEDIQSDGMNSEHVRKAVHSITERANDTSNLVTVCKKCHSSIERLPVEEQVEMLDMPMPNVRPSGST